MAKVRVLLTGGAGFIGSHLVGELTRCGHQVVILDNLQASYGRPRLIENLRAEAVVQLPASQLVACEPETAQDGLALGRAALVVGDIRDAALLASVLVGVDAVVHMAAIAGVRDSLADPLLYDDINVRGTLQLLEAMRQAGCTKLVFASSSSVYGSRTDGHLFLESDPADRPVSPYAATKRAGELMCHAAHASWGLDVTCLRFFTVYGPRQRPAMAIARFVQLALAGQPLPLFGDGSSVRDYTYVGDAARGVCAALDRLSGFDVINLSCGAPVRLDRLVEAIGEAASCDITVDYLPEQAGDVPTTRADITRAADRLGWRPRVSLREGLSHYVQWFQSQVGPRTSQ